MHDPVFTPDGITYERQSLIDHFQRNGNFDPISRRPCTEQQLIPNLSLREAIEDFLRDNGWAAGKFNYDSICCFPPSVTQVTFFSLFL